MTAAARKRRGRRRRRRSRRSRGRILRWLAWTVVILAALPPLLILPLRWVNPPISAFMLQTRWQKHTAIHYRWTKLGTIAPPLPLAVVASEDQTFPGNHGFAWGAIGKAIEEKEQGGRLRGASTITQQTAKNLFLWPGRNFMRKGIEAYFTVWVNLLWSKRRILEVYLNIAQFGATTFGAQAAAERLYSVPASALSRAQAARLAAVLPAPDRLHADRPSPYVQQRAAWIQGQMNQLGDGYLATVLNPGQ